MSDDDNDLARRQAALRALAQNQTQQPDSPQAPSRAATPAQSAKTAKSAKTAQSVKLARSTPPSALATQVIGRQAHGGRRRGVIIGGALLVVVVIVGAAVGARFLIGQRAGTPTAKSVIQLNAPKDGIVCITEAAWSPDDKQIAAQGDSQGCGESSSDSRTGLIFIYDAQTGKVMQQMQPDQLIFSAPTIEKLVAADVTQFGPSAFLFYQGMSWAPDGSALLMPFTVDFPQSGGQNAPDVSISGLLRLAVGHIGSSVVWTDPRTTFPGDMVERWDLTDGTPSLVPIPPMATAYRWTSDGTLSAADALPAHAIGTPDGGQAFSIWQMGTLTYFQSFQSGPPPQNIVDAQDILWNASAPAISPDGRFLYTYFPSYGSLVPPSTKQDDPGQPKLAPRDPALLTLAQRMAEATTPDPNIQTLVAWRPDGRQLAAISVTVNQNQGQSGSGVTPPASKFTVSIYDTQTGTLVKQLTPTFTGLQAGNSGNEQLRWSPDGSRLLLADNDYGVITIWGPGALPA